MIAPLALAVLCTADVGTATSGAQDDFAPGEAWRIAQMSAQEVDTTRRAAAVVHSLGEAIDPRGRQQRMVRAFDVFQEDHDAFRAEEALSIARAMHADAQATWSAYCLEGILRRSGDYGGAARVLEEHAARLTPGPEATDVMGRRAIVAAGAGDFEEERRHLGDALLAGSDDALQMLGRLTLVQGDTEGARRLFRAVLDRSDNGEAHGAPWALRGWGLALLPAPAEPLRRD